jgi:hypothetical protein
MHAADILRYGLLLGCACMVLIAMLYLRQRRLFWWEYLIWGLLAVGLPLLGPFLVILSQPGKSRGRQLGWNMRWQRRNR